MPGPTVFNIKISIEQMERDQTLEFVHFPAWSTSPRTARAVTQRNPVLNNKHKQNLKKGFVHFK